MTMLKLTGMTILKLTGMTISFYSPASPGFIYHLLFTIHHSPFTIYHSPLTVYPGFRLPPE
jgi:hypothetical protein